MKNILSKIAGIMTIFAIAFGTSGAALAQTDQADNQNCEQVSTSYISDDSNNSLQVDGHNAVDLAFVHPGWTASIPGSTWVWSEAAVIDGTIDTYKTFTQTFNISGTPTSATLLIAADNSYKVSVNGSSDLFVDANEDNFTSVDTHNIMAANLVSGVNTISIEVKNWAVAGSTWEGNPAGLVYKLTVNECENIEEPVCEEGELIVNGGFEYPVVTHTSGWDVYPDGTSGLGWSVAWNGSPIGAPATASLELHRGVFNPDAEGDQHTELDSDWQGPNGAGSEAASVKIWQTVTTVNGSDYEVSYTFSPRPDTIAAQNVLELWINDAMVQTTGPVAGGVNNIWTTYTYTFTGTGSDKIEFRDAGTPDTLGTFLDDVSVNCDGEGQPEVCTQGAPLFARVKINTDDATKWRNWNVGDGANLNAATPFFVGGNNPLQHGLGGDVYMGNEWFPLTNPDGSFIVDGDIAGYSDVPGVAIERQNGAIRVVLYGDHDNGGKELAAGSIELSTNASTRLLGAWDKPNGFNDPVSPYVGPINTDPRLHDATVNDLANPMDSRGTFKAYINQYDPRFDNVRVNSDLFQFHLVVTSGTDGFFARYNFDDMVEVPCGEIDPQ